MGTNNSKKKLVLTSKLSKDTHCPYCTNKIGKESTYQDVIFPLLNIIVLV